MNENNAPLTRPDSAHLLRQNQNLQEVLESFGIPVTPEGTIGVEVDAKMISLIRRIITALLQFNEPHSADYLKYIVPLNMPGLTDEARRMPVRTGGLDGVFQPLENRVAYLVSVGSHAIYE